MTTHILLLIYAFDVHACLGKTHLKEFTFCSVLFRINSVLINKLNSVHDYRYTLINVCKLIWVRKFRLSIVKHSDRSWSKQMCSCMYSKHHFFALHIMLQVFQVPVLMSDQCAMHDWRHFSTKTYEFNEWDFAVKAKLVLTPPLEYRLHNILYMYIEFHISLALNYYVHSYKTHGLTSHKEGKKVVNQRLNVSCLVNT